MALRYSCGLNGECQEDPQGRYRSVGACQRNCQAVDSKDVQYLIYGYSPQNAIDLAPLDRIEVVKRLTGAVVDPTDAYNILLGLGTDNLILLTRYPVIYDYLQQHHSMKELVPGLNESGTVEAFNILVREDVKALDYLTFLSASQYQPEVIDRLHEYKSNVLRRELIDASRKSLPALTQLFRLYPNFDPMDFDTRIPTDPDVLDDLLRRGFNQVIAGWMTEVPRRMNDKPAVKWFLKHFPQLRTAMNVVKAVEVENWHFAELVANSPSLGRASMEILIQLLYAEYEDPASNMDIEEVSRCINALHRIQQFTSIPLEVFLTYARNVWLFYMDRIVNDENDSKWVQAIMYLYEENPAWYTSEDDKDFITGNLDRVLDTVDNYLLNLDLYTDEAQAVIIDYLIVADLSPHVGILLLHAPHLLYILTSIDSSEDRVRAVLPRVESLISLQWVVENYPSLEQKLPLFQRIILQDRHTVQVEEGGRSDSFLPSELIDTTPLTSDDDDDYIY